MIQTEQTEQTEQPKHKLHRLVTAYLAKDRTPLVNLRRDAYTFGGSLRNARSLRRTNTSVANQYACAEAFSVTLNARKVACA